jgi:hypothetical protein
LHQDPDDLVDAGTGVERALGAGVVGARSGVDGEKRSGVVRTG